ncbi:MAG: holo-[acyl-carrier-protein] synthase [Clostridia bacterium]|nr:holo-[acyl-carrier-protein] synthase [Clostridia bacterium]NCC75237.1 holo-[acyl-carrier-protein] synthase [Clostridia bacterium]
MAEPLDGQFCHLQVFWPRCPTGTRSAPPELTVQILCGTDLIHIHRIEQAIIRQGESFLTRIFTTPERSYCTLPDGSFRYASLAARFAAKESIAKALGTGVGPEGIQWTDIEILTQTGGAPIARLHGAAKIRYETLGGLSLAISLTHDQDLAQAFCVLLSSGQAAPFSEDDSTDRIARGVER